MFRQCLNFSLAVFLCLCASPPSFAEDYRVGESKYPVVPRVSELKTYPCSECHSSYKKHAVNVNVWQKKHPISMKHMPEVTQCEFCHDNRNPNQLHMLDGTIVAYDKSYLLCQQCHGKTTYDWQRGLHGRLSGSWKGERKALSCTACHEAHDPEFKPMESVAKPKESEFLIRKEHGHEGQETRSH